MKRNLLQTSILGMTLLLVGCASAATGSSRSAVLLKAPAETLQVKAPTGSSLTVIRYPAVVETAARDAYQSAFISSPIGGSVSGRGGNSPDSATIADSVIVKSNYFALSLYKELVERLPEHSVLLSPHAIKLDKDGKLTSEPITQAESLGSVTTVDFVTYSFPDPEKMMGGAPLTFGDIVTPLVVVKTDHRAAPATQGILLASKPFLANSGGQGRRAALQSLSALESGRFDTKAPELAFISYLEHKSQSRLATSGLALGRETNVAQVYPLEKILLDRQALRSLEFDSKGDIDPLENAFSSAFADRIVAMINDTDVSKAVMMNKAASVSKFDSSLAALTITGSPDADYLARLRYAERLLEAEQKYLSVQSLRIYDGIHNGEMGAQVRDMLKAEFGVLEQRRDLARKQNAATALAILGAVAAGAAASSSSGNNTSYSDVLLTQTLANAAIFAGTKAFSYKRQSAAVGSNYLTSIVPAIEEQITVQVNLLESSETITAIRFEDLQEKLQTLYTKNQRSLDTIATRCAYTPAGSAQKGAWLGVCKDGLAAGQGIGALRGAGGSATEYFGDAKNGMPNGAGYMIYHSGAGSYSVEGNFVGGVPDGVMRVSKAGKPDMMRLYKNGQDSGGAPSGAVNISPFNVANMAFAPSVKGL